MKGTLLSVFFLISVIHVGAQPASRDKKYPSLLWEIRGKGLKKSSWLIGTMHVSSKIAFNLPDSFYYALRHADVVALETNPETWQEDMNKYELGEDGISDFEDLLRYSPSLPSDYLSINTLKFYRYENKIERALYSNPSVINNLLYRSFGNESSDFEEDTYLDMYIFQCGKKWGKRISGVENYGESMQLMVEAYQDAARDKNRKERSYGDWDEAYSSDKLQDAYRLGNLDLLDSINKYNSISEAFDEKFLYRRNEIQAENIDSILRTGSALFVGVGAAHLPGSRGVIEILRKKGYTLRPVKMGQRSGRDKEQIDKVRVPVSFQTETATDGMFSVDIPGKLYKTGDDGGLDQWQYADMSNGSYYMVTRVMTNAWMWNQQPEDVYRAIDSLLYENIPGKIISKTAVSRNGYKGFDITNRTRRGDLQRYQVYITPFEVIFFKISGNGDYIKNGKEAEKFFGSIRLKTYPAEGPITWKKFKAPWGGFTAEWPHEPYIGNDGSWIFDGADAGKGIFCRVIRSDIHNHHFVEEDSFDLGLMEESFMASDFIDTVLARKFITHQGYPALQGTYRDKSGAIFLTRFIIQGPHYYTVTARGRNPVPEMEQFLHSFLITPYTYAGTSEQTDSTLYYRVNSIVVPEEKKIRLRIPRYSWLLMDAENESEEENLSAGAYRSRVIANDSTGEKIYVSFSRSSRYYYTKDSLAPERNHAFAFVSDTSFIYRFAKRAEFPGNFKTWEMIVSDTGSSRCIRTKVFYKDGISFKISTLTDTLSAPSLFVRSFFDSFTPADTLEGVNPFEKKSALFFDDLASADSIRHKRAVKNIERVVLDMTDLPSLRQAIKSISWNEKKYLESKTALINKLGAIRTPEAADFLKELYYEMADTIQLQYAALENLLRQQTGYAFGLFRDIINDEPPVLGFNPSGYDSYKTYDLFKTSPSLRIHNGRFMDELFDSLVLTKTILTDLLTLLNLDDYKSQVMRLLGRMVDSNLVTAKDYSVYFSKFLLEARQELKKQTIAEKSKAIEKAEENKMAENKDGEEADDEKDKGNADLSLYARLLLPFRETNPAVPPVLEQMLASDDKRLKYSIFMLLLEKGMPFPDSLPDYFAASDEYRYEFYVDLKERKRLEKFPAIYNNHLALSRGALLAQKRYDRPDSLVYLSVIPTEFMRVKGLIYFFKYKTKKDDLAWKIATVGLIPEDSTLFEFDDERVHSLPYEVMAGSGVLRRIDFIELSNTRIRNDQPLDAQLQKLLRKMLYSRRKSAKEFYIKGMRDTD
jgi:uncharacterized protein YbaP (TraB family)